jgi:hypothetical protein
LITFLSLEQFPEVDLQFTEDTTTELIERLPGLKKPGVA